MSPSSSGGVGGCGADGIHAAAEVYVDVESELPPGVASGSATALFSGGGWPGEAPKALWDTAFQAIRYFRDLRETRSHVKRP
jgi:hypothetical protein